MVAINRIKRFIPLIISIMLALVLFFLVEDFVRTVIIGPLLYVIWFVSLVVDSIPQGVIWAIFILVMLVIALTSLRSNRAENQPVGWRDYQKYGPVERWSRLLTQAKKDKFTRWRLANELKRLTRKLLSSDDDPNIYKYHPEMPGLVLRSMDL